MKEVFTAIKPLKSVYKMPFSTYRLVLLQAASRRPTQREGAGRHPAGLVDQRAWLNPVQDSY